MKKAPLFVLVLIAMVSCTAEKPAAPTTEVNPARVVPLPALKKPTALAVDDTQLYVIEEIKVSIYALKDFALKKEFGQAGEGPREFKPEVTVFPQQDSLLISSPGKLSFYTKDGKFLKEIKSTTYLNGSYQPLGSGYAGLGMAVGKDKSTYFTINIFDSQLTKSKEVHRIKLPNPGRFEFPIKQPQFRVLDNKIITVGEEGFKINIFDHQGKIISTIRREYKKLKVTEKYKQSIHQHLKTNPMSRAGYEQIKNLVRFPDYFPVIQFLYAADKKIYAMTYRENNGSYETLIFTIDGKFSARVFLPLKFQDALKPYPNAIKDNKLYQLLDNGETEKWELHITAIK